MKIKSGYCAGLAWQTLSNVKLVLLCQIFCSHHSARPLCRPTSWFRINRNIQRRFSRHKPNSIKSGCTGLLPPHPARLVDKIVTIVKSNKESLMWDDEMRLSVCIDFAGLLTVGNTSKRIPRLKTEKPQAPRKTHLRTTTATYSVKLIIFIQSKVKFEISLPMPHLLLAVTPSSPAQPAATPTLAIDLLFEVCKFCWSQDLQVILHSWRVEGGLLGCWANVDNLQCYEGWR